jgi:hypothetical protein
MQRTLPECRAAYSIDQRFFRLESQPSDRALHREQ